MNLLLSKKKKEKKIFSFQLTEKTLRVILKGMHKIGSSRLEPHCSRLLEEKATLKSSKGFQHDLGQTNVQQLPTGNPGMTGDSPE